MTKTNDLINLNKEELEHLLWDNPTTDRRLRNKLIAILDRRANLIDRLNLCQRCQQIRIAQYPRK